MYPHKHTRPPKGVDICPNCHEIITPDKTGAWQCDNCGARSAPNPHRRRRKRRSVRKPDERS